MSEVEFGGQGTGAAQQHTIQGQVSHCRRLSSKLVFYDVLQSSSDPDSCTQWWEVVVKAGIYGSVQDVKDVRDTIKLGDIVEVTGYCEPHVDHLVLQAVAIRVIKSWKEYQPGAHFTPCPAPKVQHAQQQQDTATQQPQPVRVQELAQRGVHGECSSRGLEDAADATAAEAMQFSGPPHQKPISSSTTEITTAAGTAQQQLAVKVSGPKLSVCKFWINTGRCTKGAACPHLHALPATAGGLACRKRSVLQQRELDRRQRAADKGCVYDSSSAAKRQRAQVFAAWLVQQYGKERLNTGAGVLDVAGGSGSLTFELAFVHGIKCTLVDARPLKLNKLQHMLLGQAGRTAVIKTLTLEQLQQGATWAASATQDQQSVSAALTGVRLQQDNAPAAQQNKLALNLQSLDLHGSAQQLSDGHLDPVCLQQVQALFGPELWSTSSWQQLFKDCSLVVGLHPDQATEPILEFAVQQHVPFAIMPCCVFPRLFPHRQLLKLDGVSTPVVSYEDLVEYLVQQGGAQRHVLQFEGANVAVYRPSIGTATGSD